MQSFLFQSQAIKNFQMIYYVLCSNWTGNLKNIHLFLLSLKRTRANWTLLCSIAFTLQFSLFHCAPNSLFRFSKKTEYLFALVAFHLLQQLSVADCSRFKNSEVSTLQFFLLLEAFYKETEHLAKMITTVLQRFVYSFKTEYKQLKTQRSVSRKKYLTQPQPSDSHRTTVPCSSFLTFYVKKT